MSTSINKSTLSCQQLLITLLLSFVISCGLSTSAFAQTEPLVDVGVAVNSVNINTASAEDIALHLKGIGLKKAKAIVAWREEYGAFSSIEDLSSVKGIGEKTVQRNREKILLQ